MSALRNPTVLALGLFLVLNVAWTWPLVLDPLDVNIALQMDAPNTLGLSAAVAQADNPFRPELTNWPQGQVLARADSFVFFTLARLLAWLPATLPNALCILLGPPLSALAAERLARELGARMPWSLLAGLAYGFSGLNAMFILEGYAFNVLNPWLPAMALYTMRALGEEGRPRDGLLGAAMWMLALLTTAYAGITASLVLVGLLFGHGRALRRPSRPILALLGGVLLSGTLFVLAYALAPAEAHRASPDAQSSIAMMTTGSSRLVTLFWRTPTADLAVHSQGALIGATSFLLSLFLPLLPGQAPRGARRLVAIGLALTLLSLGPVMRLYISGPGMPWLLHPLAELGAGAWLRFPDRLVLGATLAFGVAGALLLTAVGRHRPRLAGLLLVAGLLDAVVGAGLPLRSRPGTWSVPSAYLAAPEGRAVLDLWPHFVGYNREHEVRLSRRAVGYAALHGRPVLTDALNVSPVEDHRRPVADWVMGWAMSGAHGNGIVPLRLDAIGIGAVALHVPFFLNGTRDQLYQGLRLVLGEPSAWSVDHGAYVILWTIPAMSQTTRDQRMQALAQTIDEVR